MLVKRLLLKSIRLDFQPHEKLLPATVEKYMERMRSHRRIEPVIVCHDGNNFSLKDGFHRVEAARGSGRKTIMAEVIYGALADMEAEWQQYVKKLKSDLAAAPKKGE